MLDFFWQTGSELQAEVENLALRLFYMESAKEDVRSDISVMKRAAKKADTEVAKAEIAKQKQVRGLPFRIQKCIRHLSLVRFSCLFVTEKMPNKF